MVNGITVDVFVGIGIDDGVAIGIKVAIVHLTTCTLFMTL